MKKITPIMEISQAEKIAEKLQRVPAGNRTPCKIDGDTVMVKPLSGNAFLITDIPAAEPMKRKSYETIKDIATDINIERESGSLFYITALVTWNTMVHYLIRTGVFTLRK